MGCAHDSSIDDEGAVTLGEPGGAQVRLWNRVASDDEVIKSCVEIVASTETQSLSAAVHAVTLVVVRGGSDAVPDWDRAGFRWLGWCTELAEPRP
jgi:hypothetical protein